MIANHRSLKEQYWYIITIIDYVDIWQVPLPSANLCKQKNVIPTASDKRHPRVFNHSLDIIRQSPSALELEHMWTANSNVNDNCELSC